MSLRPESDPYGLEAAYRDATTPPKAERVTSKKSSTKKPLYKRVWFWLLVFFVVLLLAVPLLINPLATYYTRKELNSIPGYKGDFKSVGLSIIPLKYGIEGLMIDKANSKDKEPMLFAENIEVTLVWRQLIRLQPVGSVKIEKTKIVYRAGEAAAKPVANKSEEKTDEKGQLSLATTLQKIIPVRIDRVEVRDSELSYIDGHGAGAPNMWVNDIELVIENIVTRKNLDNDVPMAITMRAVAAKTAIVKMIATADVLVDPPAFTGQAQLSGLELESLYEWTQAKAGISASGTADVFANFNSAKNKLSGDVKVIIRKAKVKPASDKLTDALKAKLANAAITILSDRVEGRDAIATTLPIKGTLDTPDPQIWPTILGVVRNAFVQGLDWGFSDLPTPTSDKKEGALGQAANALDKNQDAPKAQPNPKGDAPPTKPPSAEDKADAKKAPKAEDKKPDDKKVEEKK